MRRRRRAADEFSPSSEAGRRLRRVEGDLREVAARLVELDDVDDDVERTRLELRAVEARAEEHDESFARLRPALERIRRRLDSLERRLRQSSDSTVCNLVTVSPRERRLADAAEHGRQLAAELLPAEVRGHLEHLVARRGAWVRERDARAAAVLAAARVLADGDVDTPGRDGMTTAFQAADAALTEHDTAPGRDPREATTARDRLATDNADRARTADAVEAGERAWVSLLVPLRTRINDGFARGDFFPVWFSTALGDDPPRDDPGHWVETATLVVAYRMTYGVTDPVVPLGEDPGPVGPRAALHRQICDDLTRYQD